MNLESSSTLILGSISKIEFIHQSFIDVLPDPNGYNLISESAITLLPGKSWNTIIPVPDSCSLQTDSNETASGDNISGKVEGSVISKELYLLRSKLKGKLLLKVTDGNGEKYLIGNKEEFAKIQYSGNVPASINDARRIDFTFNFSLTNEIPSLY